MEGLDVKTDEAIKVEITENITKSKSQDDQTVTIAADSTANKPQTIQYDKRFTEWSWNEVHHWIMKDPNRFAWASWRFPTGCLSNLQLTGKQLLKTTPGTLAKAWNIPMHCARNLRTEALQIEASVKAKEQSKSCCKRMFKSKAIIMISLFFQIILCWTPIWDIITDILTIILYFNSDDSVSGLISIIILVYAFRNQLVFFSMMATEDMDDELPNPCMYMCTGIPKIDMLLLIPYFGPALACTRQQALDDLKDKDISYDKLPIACCFSFLFAGICSECCMISFGVCAGPVIVIVVVLKRFWINIQNMATICKGEIITIEAEQKHRGNKSMFILLKFVEAITEALPQLALQTYVFINSETYSDKKALILFCFSIALSVISLIKLIYQIISKWVDILEAMEREVYDPE
eukprot:229295_1